MGGAEGCGTYLAPPLELGGDCQAASTSGLCRLFSSAAWRVGIAVSSLKLEGRRQDEFSTSISECGGSSGPPPQLQPPHPASGGGSVELLQRARRRGRAAGAHRGPGGQAQGVSKESQGWGLGVGGWVLEKLGRRKSTGTEEAGEKECLPNHC